MKIFRVDLQKAKNNIKNKIEGYPRVERGNRSPFSFVNSSETFQYLKFVVFKKPAERTSLPKHIHLNNPLPSENYNWNSSGLQLTQKKTRPRKNSLRLNHSVFWAASGRKSRWNMTANQKTGNHNYCFSTNQKKKTESGFWTQHPTSKLSRFPSPRLNKGESVWSQVTKYCNWSLGWGLQITCKHLWGACVLDKISALSFTISLLKITACWISTKDREGKFLYRYYCDIESALA